MLVPARFAPQRLAMTTVAIRLSAEQFIAAFGGCGIKIDSRPRLHRRQRQLIELQRGQLACDQIVVRIDRDMTKVVCCGNGELSRIVEAFVKECTDPVHFVHCHERVPVRNCSPAACPCVEIVTRAREHWVSRSRLERWYRSWRHSLSAAD